MKEIKAYIRRDRVAAAVERLRDAGAPGISVVGVHAIGHGGALDCIARSEDVLARSGDAMVKVEVVCADAEAERLVDVLCDAGHTGFRGDGLVVVSDVVDAVRIIDGSSGEVAVRR